MDDRPEQQHITVRKLHATEKQLISRIADWYAAEWSTPVEKTLRRLTAKPGEDVLFQLVLEIKGRVIATGGLARKVNLLKVHERFKAYSPWVALLYTEKSYRGMGQILLDEIERLAKKEGFSSIYTYTFTAESLYAGSGWKPLARVPYKGEDTVVMEKSL
ncbi:GNAT family N-acetyltransferase [Sinomicrobium weinanense]|uniref:N-acetyltransferase domain-containing protein n=1 Tax=Sinomicrobium weinanense TaxID=2842200 RepID=A0A926JUE9_9FLAO|nr:GNAT family N-acetyltransferase [Sinomicrobium weinanense]MBC9797569.1 hypothetical protein [Sinomicrobium weinanense]MBU3123636.1 GNAT family N-acetyltransferase [Sinomicrobium weinanense]